MLRIRRAAAAALAALLLLGAPAAGAAGPEDLDAAGSTAAYPHAGSYLRESYPARVNAPHGRAVYCVPGSGGQGKDFAVAQDTVVQVLARENGRSCVITPDGRSGWINSDYLLRVRAEAGWLLAEAVFYDGQGRETRREVYTYDEDGLLEELRETEAGEDAPAVTRYDRDGMPLGQPYDMVCDSLGQRFWTEGFDESAFSPEDYDVRVRCDEKGRVVSVTAADGEGTIAAYSYRYDADGRFTKYHFKGAQSDGSTPRPETTVQFLYHSDGTRERRYDKCNEDVSYTATRLWDAQGRLLSITQRNRRSASPTGTTDWRLELDYDEQGTFTGSRLYEDGRLVSEQDDMAWFEAVDYVVLEPGELSPAAQALTYSLDFAADADETETDENGNVVSARDYGLDGALRASAAYRYVYYDPAA
ncbi:MAG: hypothetical protein IJ594_07125 [Oscillospiraceae bacterium]|nr:hypothetical protein [Oscillospiraceae bacterium]